MNPLNSYKPAKYPPFRFIDWIEFLGLLLINPTFQRSPDKREAYYEYRLGKQYTAPFH